MTHTELVTKLKKPAKVMLAETTERGIMLHHMVLGLAGEVGEIVDNIKKYTIYKQPIDKDNLIEELGDLEFYLEGLRQEFNITREECIQGNVNKLLVRYEGAIYSDKAAKERKDKQ